ncbi:MAG: S-layer homology domain-containing protein [Casimicrobiaceae bacterium]
MHRTKLFGNALAWSVAALIGTISPVAPAHEGAHDATHTRGAAAVETTASGVIRSIVVEDRVTTRTYVYNALESGDGHSYLLRGASANALHAGDAYVIRGPLRAHILRADFAEPSAAPVTTARSAAVATVVDGVLRLGHADNFDGAASAFFYSVVSADGHMTNIALASGIDTIKNGMTVSVSGTRATNGEMFADRIIVLAHPDPSLLPTDAKSLIEKSATTNQVLVIPIKFPTNTDVPYTYAADPFTIPAITTAVFGASPAQSAAEYYKDVSYGQHLLAGQVANVTSGWLKATSVVPRDVDNNKLCDINVISTLAEQAATAAGYKLNNYTNLVYLFEANSFKCGWSGLAYIGWGRAYILQTTSLLVIGHELGHNFGLYHAASLDCGASVDTAPCTSSEYGDPFDVMGNQRAMQFNVFQKNSLGWIPASSVYKHTTGTATYTIAPLEQSGATHYGISVAANRYRTYWIEYRQPLGFDASGLAGVPSNGAQVRIASPFESICSGCADDTEFLDFTPSTTAFTDGALLAGQQFTDAFGVTISVKTATPTALTVEVTARPKQSFADVPTDFSAYAPIETLYWNQITAGCATGPLIFCPAANVTRAEMAVFMERERLGFYYVYKPTGKVFADVPLAYSAAGPIEQFYADGIDPGCASSPLRFCPDDVVSRAQMAVMLLKGLYGKTYTPPAATGLVFADVPKTLPQAAWIEKLYSLKITLGCTATTYCPDGTITRAEMAVFFGREFSLPPAP